MTQLQVEQKEFYTNELSHIQQWQAKDLLVKFSGKLSDLPGKSKDIEQHLRLTDHTPSIVKRHPFGFQHIMGGTFGTRKRSTRDNAESKFHDQTFQNNCGKYVRSFFRSRSFRRRDQAR
ncbi:hypothetical protein PoB_003301100 [Plakobranchus ocellatus]|uniref:Uncharacterized protein n=1 Tax=Plakobranchus ocellatus TaxID=259542 RepID=A0AAV4A5J7_9GAST|nr:hypothetical protein PoB_003301100 [Plakobranchus ocellatus]